MSGLSEKISYLKGLAEGMSISEASNEGKLISKMIEVLDDAAREINDLRNSFEELDEAAADVDMELDDIYNIIDHMSGDDFDDYDEDDDYDDDDDLFEVMDDEEDGLFEIMCPECGEDVIVDFDMLDDDNNIVCPNCHKDIDLEFDVPEDEAEDDLF